MWYGEIYIYDIDTDTAITKYIKTFPNSKKKKKKKKELLRLCHPHVSYKSSLTPFKELFFISVF